MFRIPRPSKNRKTSENIDCAIEIAPKPIGTVGPNKHNSAADNNDCFCHVKNGNKLLVDSKMLDLICSRNGHEFGEPTKNKAKLQLTKIMVRATIGRKTLRPKSEKT